MIFRLRNILLLSAAAVSAVVVAENDTAAPQAHQLDNSYTYEQYLTHFNKSYDNTEEHSRRSQTFARNLETILRHNEGRMTDDGDIIDGGYVMGVNRFTDVERGEMPLGYNSLMHPAWRSQLVGGGASKTERLLGATDTVTASYSKPPDIQMDDVSSLPTEMDWAKEGKINPIIPNQGGCGSCWTFAATGVIESHLAIATGECPVSLSEQNILQCSPNPDHCGGTGDCSGSTVELALNYIADITAKKTGGMFNIADVPYSGSVATWDKCGELTEGKSASVGIEGWTQLPLNDYEATMNAIAKVGPLAVAVAASEWGFYEKGVYDGSGNTAEGFVVNHAVLLVGYGVDEDTKEKYYKVRNSWGPTFGEDGFIRIKRTDEDSKLCKKDNQPLAGMACALDDNGNTIDVEAPMVCGTDAILFDVSFPVNVHKIE